MTDSTLNSFLARGTNAARLAFTPSPPTPASGPSPTYIWHETDTGDTYAYNGASWNKVNAGASTGSIGMMALDGRDGEDGLSIPGLTGATGATGAAGSAWYAGNFPTAAILSTLWRATLTSSAIVLTDDAQAGLLLDSTDYGQVGGNFKVAVQATPSDASDWTATCHIAALQSPVNNVSFGMVLGEATGSTGAWPLVNIWGPGTFSGQFLDLIEALTDFSYNSNRFQRAIVDASGTWWLRIRWVLASTKYFFDVSVDGKLWLNVGSQSKADLLFNSRATHVGLGFYMNGANATTGKIIANCDYWHVA